MGVRKPEEAPSCPPEHSHNRWCFQSHGCRCESCRGANRRHNSVQHRQRMIRARNPNLMLSARGARRRLQALAVMGWGNGDVAKHTGLSSANLAELRSGFQPSCRARTHALIARAYEELWDQKRTGRAASYVRGNATRNGWYSPLHWDDIDKDTEEGASGEEL